MSKKINKAVVRSFLLRRKSNALGLTILTAASAIITLLCAMMSHKHTDILALCTVALAALCLVQLIKSRRLFKTMKKKSFHRKKATEQA